MNKFKIGDVGIVVRSGKPERVNVLAVFGDWVWVDGPDFYPRCTPLTYNHKAVSVPDELTPDEIESEIALCEQAKFDEWTAAESAFEARQRWVLEQFEF